MKEKIKIQEQKLNTGSKTERDLEKFEEKAKIFHEYFPEGTIEPIGRDSIPEAAIERLYKGSKRYVDERAWTPDNISEYYQISLSNKEIIYLAKELKQMGSKKDCYRDEWTYFSFLDGDERIIWAEMTRNIMSPFESGDKYKGKSNLESLFLERDETLRYKKKRGGYGERLARAVNAYSQAMYSSSLHTDPFMIDDSPGFWDRLEEKGLVKKVRDMTQQCKDERTGKIKKIFENRYVFLDNKK